MIHWCHTNISPAHAACILAICPRSNSIACIIWSHAAICLKSLSAWSTSVAFRRTSRICRSFSAPTNSAVDPSDGVSSTIGSPHCGGARGGWERGVGEALLSKSEANNRRALGFLEGLAPSPVSLHGRLLLWATPVISHLSLRAAHDQQMRTCPAGAIGTQGPAWYTRHSRACGP